MNFIKENFLNFTISSAQAKSYFLVSLTLLAAVLLDSILRSLIKVPKNFDNRRSRTYITILRNLITVVIYGLALHIIFLELGISLAPLFASSAILGILIGIGARPMIEDLISGIFLLTQSSIALGDYIKVDDAEGTIESMDIRTMSIRAQDGSLYIIPNGQIKKMINYSRHKAHVLIDLPVKNDQKIETALKAASEALDETLKDEEIKNSLYPGSQVEGIEAFQPLGPMIIRATLITYPAMRFKVARKYRFLAKKAFENHKVSLG